jgi:uncharacterized protein YcaQ
MNTLFIYAKDGEITVKDLDNSLWKHDDIIKQGWTHTATINPSLFIQYLHNECNAEEMVKEITELGKSP